MEESERSMVRCLWHAADGRCSNCKARRIRNDVLKIKDYHLCEGESFYPDCEFYVAKPKLKR
ncbi:MAG: hypothetical protein SA339_00015 [Methanomassiliicoccus sp.]|nr:hypothetical protein [Methanomassiliicoccus sp.]